MKIKFFTKSSNSFSANVLKLVTGTVMAQAMGILVMPVVTRLFAPEAFGVVAIFTSMTSIVGVIVCLRYEAAIMLPKTDEEAANILGVCLLSVIIVTFFSAMIIWFGSEKIISMLHAPQLRNYLWLVPVTIFIQGFFLALNYWNTRTKHFGRLSVAQILSSITNQSTKLVAGFAGFISGGVLIGAFALGNFVSTAVLSGKIWHDDKKLFLDHIKWKAVGKGFVRFKKFPLIDTSGALLNSISWQLPALMLSPFFSISIVGFYSLGLTMVKLPLSIIAGALSQVFYQKACDERYVENNNGLLVENLTDKLMFIGLLPMIIFAVAGAEIFAFIFGNAWYEAGFYAQILAPWCFVWFISSPLSVLFSVYERQGTALAMHVMILLTRIISLYIGGIYHNIYLALGLFSATGVIVYSFVIAWNCRMAKANGKKILINLTKYFLCTLPALLCLVFVKYTLQMGMVAITLSSLLILFSYILIFRKKAMSMYVRLK